MICLSLVGENGNTLYFDVHHVGVVPNKEEVTFSLSGTLGDGIHEEEVFVEVGGQVKVTFVDQVLSHAAVNTFSASREEIERSLVETVAGLSFSVQSSPGSTRKGQRRIVRFRCDGPSEEQVRESFPHHPLMHATWEERHVC